MDNEFCGYPDQNPQQEIYFDLRSPSDFFVEDMTSSDDPAIINVQMLPQCGLDTNTAGDFMAYTQEYESVFVSDLLEATTDELPSTNSPPSPTATIATSCPTQPSTSPASSAIATKRSVSPDTSSFWSNAPTRRFKKPKVYHSPDNDDDNLIMATQSKDLKARDEMMFMSLQDCKDAMAKNEQLYVKPQYYTTNPENDSTFPQTNEQMKDLVFPVYRAIMDWGCFIEWMQVVHKDVRETRADQLATKISDHHKARENSGMRNGGLRAGESVLQVQDLVPTPDVLKSAMPDIGKQHQEVLGRPCINFTAECIAWKLVEAAIQSQQGRSRAVCWTTSDGAWESYVSLDQRVKAIAHVLRVSKQVLKSTMTVGDGWIIRVANNPCSELQGKVDNMRCNLKKNKSLRDAKRVNQEVGVMNPTETHGQEDRSE